jgi:hypothetical protein
VATNTGTNKPTKEQLEQMYKADPPVEPDALGNAIVDVIVAFPLAALKSALTVAGLAEEAVAGVIAGILADKATEILTPEGGADYSGGTGRDSAGESRPAVSGTGGTFGQSGGLPKDKPHEKWVEDCSKAPTCWCGEKHCGIGVTR